MTTAIRSHPRRRRLVRVAALAALATLVTACNGTWGVRATFRGYVASPASQGNITTQGGVEWLDGAGTAKGPFRWPLDWATMDAGTGVGTVQFRGAITMAAHPSGSDDALDISIWNPRLEIDGDTGTLIADLNYRPFAGTGGGALPTLEAALDVPFATVDLSGSTLTPDANGTFHITDAPMVGIDAAMALIGFDAFYGSPVALDPLTVAFNPDTFQRSLATTPTITVSKSTGLRPGDEITVWGTGFDPAAHVGTRPPFAGQPSGAYVIFGKFSAPWKPSGGAPSASRTVIDQKWALPAASRAILDPTGTSTSFATIDTYGRFEAVLTVGTSAAAGSYGVFTYPGSGAVNAAYELEVPVTLAP